MKNYPLLKNGEPVLYKDPSTRRHVFNNAKSGDIYTLLDKKLYSSLYSGLYKRDFDFSIFYLKGELSFKIH